MVAKNPLLLLKVEKSVHSIKQGIVSLILRMGKLREEVGIIVSNKRGRKERRRVTPGGA